MELVLKVVISKRIFGEEYDWNIMLGDYRLYSSRNSRKGYESESLAMLEAADFLGDIFEAANHDRYRSQSN